MSRGTLGATPHRNSNLFSRRYVDERIDGVIDEFVYDLYGLTDEKSPSLRRR
jgi:hypothetical protein